MKRIIIILSLILIASIGFAQTEAIRGNQFELTGKIIKEIGYSPHCGSIAWATVIEFEIIEFSDRNYKQTSIPIIFTCPEFYGEEFFELGKTYTMTLTDENQADFSWAILNDSILTKYPLDKKLWVLKTEKNNKE